MLPGLGRTLPLALAASGWPGFLNGTAGFAGAGLLLGCGTGFNTTLATDLRTTGLGTGFLGADFLTAATLAFAAFAGAGFLAGFG